MAEMSDLELLDALGVEATQKKEVKYTPLQERIIAGFEEIQRFVEEQGRVPSHNNQGEIFERIYAVRLDQIRKLPESKELLSDIDHQKLLNTEIDETPEAESDEELLSLLGATEAQEDDITVLKHVKSRAEVKAAEEIASRTPCEDFDRFKPVFDAVQQELDSGARETRPYGDYAEVLQGDLFILSGQKVFVADVGKEFINDYGKKDSRLRVIYDNGTESDILLRSLQRALNKDTGSRRIIDNSPGPLFSDVSDDDDLSSGTIYVLRSKSDHPAIQGNREIIHKIGVTGGDVKRRIANAKHDATYLLADVEVIATYELFNINRTKLEKLLHKFFDAARLEVQIADRFGHPVEPREWFLVPFEVIDEVIEKIKDGSISDYIYDIESASLVRY